MKRYFFLILFLLILVGEAQAQEEIKFVKSSMSQFLETEIGTRTQDKNKSHFFSLLDMNRFTEKAIVDFKGQLSPEQKQEFISLFSNLLNRHLLKDADRFTSKNLKDLRYRIKSRSAEESEVQIDAFKRGKPIQLIYVVARVEGQWRIADVSVEGVLLSRNYRGQFNRIYRVEGFSGLMNRINQKLAMVSKPIP